MEHPNRWRQDASQAHAARRTTAAGKYGPARNYAGYIKNMELRQMVEAEIAQAENAAEIDQTSPEARLNLITIWGCQEGGVMQRNNDQATHHQIVATITCPVLLPAVQDGDIDALLDALLSAAERLLRRQMTQSMVESEHDR